MLSALATVDVEPGQFILIVDSVTDIQVTKASGVRSIGYAKAPGGQAALDAV